MNPPAPIVPAPKPNPTYWPIPRAWPGETVFILAGGPSLARADLEQLRGLRTIVINRSFRLAPWATLMYFCDKHYWVLDGAEIREKFTGDWIVTMSRTIHPMVKVIQNTGTAGLEQRPIGVKHGTNSGYQAINLAYLLGAARIVLLGYDMKTQPDKTHAHEGYGIAPAKVAHVLNARMLPYFPRLAGPLKAAGVEVLNANPDSALDVWPKIDAAELRAIADSSKLAKS